MISIIAAPMRSRRKAALTVRVSNCRRGFTPRLLVKVSFLIFTFQLAADAEDSFRAGAYAIDITPSKFPVPMVGSMTPKMATSAHDPLHARCLVLDDGKTQIAFAIVDSCLIPREIWDAAKTIASTKTGIPVSHMLGAATHTHTAVCVYPGFQGIPDKDYQEFLTQRIGQGIAEAYMRLEPARYAFGRLLW